ncbi:uncharacterized protein LOC125595024 [Brassica napus]|uniref:uncharacterized protein LOC106447725 n=1 Tax=Brassica napus TaxID=3708 RepID=UPI0006AAFD62|nr:uncharacterized protein LOC106447725 [Brassica napus]XP_048626961.1 uncharacterized protein LOC125595024 [Brassica napus]
MKLCSLVLKVQYYNSFVYHRLYTKCVFCGLQETVDHLFISCQFATSVWEAAPFSNVQATLGTTNFTSALQASRKLVNLPPTGVHLVSLFPWIVWTIWLTRNQRIFQNREFDGRATLTKAITDAREWQQAQQEVHRAIELQTDPEIQPTSTIIINTDAAWKEETKTAGIAWIFYDVNGKPFRQGSGTEEWVSSPIMAEALCHP